MYKSNSVQRVRERAEGILCKMKVASCQVTIAKMIDYSETETREHRERIFVRTRHKGKHSWLCSISKSLIRKTLDFSGVKT